MKLTRILPRPLAIEWQRYDLSRSESILEYHKEMTKIFQYAVDEGRTEMNRLKKVKN